MTNDDSSMDPGGYACNDVLTESGRSPTFARTLRRQFATGADAAPRIATLVSTIEGRVVPRLMLSRQLPTATVATSGAEDALDPRDLEELTRLLVQSDATVAKSYVLQVRNRGVPLDNLCLGLLAPAARRLGEMWEEDLCDFATVTVGLCHLHEVLRDVGSASRPDTAGRSPTNSVLLVPLPGEQHTFGLLMVAEFFRRNGWSVTTEYPSTAADLMELVNAERYSLLGLTIGCREQLDGLSSRITQLRRASRNRGIGVMLGGRLFSEQPELAARLGADATAADARAAASQADSFVRLIG
jgi:methanogenic corrinoid protein MtbC1